MGVILGPFSPNLGENDIPWKKGCVSFLILQLITIVPKIRKDKCAIPEKNAELTDGQKDNVDFIGPSVGLGSNNLATQHFQRIYDMTFPKVQ